MVLAWTDYYQRKLRNITRENCYQLCYFDVCQNFIVLCLCYTGLLQKCAWKASVHSEYSSIIRTIIYFRDFHHFCNLTSVSLKIKSDVKAILHLLKYIHYNNNSKMEIKNLIFCWIKKTVYFQGLNLFIRSREDKIKNSCPK